MSDASAFLDALDVLTLRGNRLFGDPGSWGESLMPPPPTVAAGALRSHLLARDGVDLAAFARGALPHPEVGSPDAPGTFTLAAFHLARRLADGIVEPLYPMPADLVVSGNGAARRIDRLVPAPIDALAGSAALPLWPVLAQADERGKPVTGLWLSCDGLRAWMAGRPVDAARHIVAGDALWKTEARVGVGLEAERGRAKDRSLFSLQAVSFTGKAGFVVRVQGAAVTAGVLRFGGDGRGARLEPARVDWPEPDFDAMAQARRARLLLTSPGIFERGWLPTGAGEPSPTVGATFDLHGVRGRIVAAAVPRAPVVSGFDLARWQPKPAQRAAAAGSVYWLDDLDATPEALRKLAEHGLWTEAQYTTDMRRAEGFNRVALAQWN